MTDKFLDILPPNVLDETTWKLNLEIDTNTPGLNRLSQGMLFLRSAREQALREVANYIRTSVVPSMFEEGEAGLWDRLSDKREKNRKREGFPYPQFPILINSGDLFREATNVQEYINSTDDGSTLEMGNALEQSGKWYAHMTGQGGFGPIPIRQFFPVGEENLDSYEVDDMNDIMLDAFHAYWNDLERTRIRTEKDTWFARSTETGKVYYNVRNAKGQFTKRV